ncbi:hypothetical protein WN943_003263 [Citrus x changshan-huyou]
MNFRRPLGNSLVIFRRLSVFLSSIRPSIEMTKVKNIMVDAIPLTTIHATMSDVGSCELKWEIDEDGSAYIEEIIKRKEVINLENSKDEDELVVEDTHLWQM